MSNKTRHRAPAGVPRPAPAAGWYPDPTDGGRLRWWDGTRWSAPTSATNGGVAQPEPRRREGAQPSQPTGEATRPGHDPSEEWSGTPDPAPAAAPPPRNDAPRHAPQAAAGAPSSAPPNTPGGPPQGSGTAVVRGQARAVHLRSLGGQPPSEVLQFRLEQYDAAGNRGPRIQVELRSNAVLGGRISGQVNDNDDVEVEGVWHNGILRAQTITNLSTGARLQPHSHLKDLSDAMSGKTGRKVRRGVLLIVGLMTSFVVVAVVGWLLWMFFIFNSAQEAEEEWCRTARDNGFAAQCEDVP